METQVNSDGLGAAVAGTDLPPVSPQLFPGEPDGEAFDASIHAVNEDGSPRLTAEGRFAKKRGRGGTRKADREEEGERKAAAATCTTLFLSLARGIGGEEWQPEDGEREEIQQSFEEYFTAAGTIDLPPGLALVVSLAGFGMRRLDRPETRRRISSLFRRMRPQKINGVRSTVASQESGNAPTDYRQT